MVELLTVREVAQTEENPQCDFPLTRLHEMTIWRYIRSGWLEAVRIGRRLRVRPEAVEKLLQPGQEARPSTPSEDDDERYLRDDDAIWSIVGLVKGGPTNLSEDKYAYLDEPSD